MLSKVHKESRENTNASRIHPSGEMISSRSWKIGCAALPSTAFSGNYTRTISICFSSWADNRQGRYALIVTEAMAGF